VVGDEVRGVQLVDFLERELPPTRPLHLRHLVSDGLVRVNGEVVRASRRLHPGDVVQVRSVELPAASAIEPAGLEVKFESATALVVQKPPGLPTVPDRSGKDTGVHGLLPALRPEADLRIVHRLDRNTSGCLLLAKGGDAARHFDREFREGTVRKRYVALVHGVVARPSFAIDAWLGPDPRRPGRVVSSPHEQPGFKSAHTAVAVRSAFLDHSLLDVRPTTGRGHQLRVHLASIGHPIVADRDYGGKVLLLSELKRGYKLRPGTVECPLLDRMFLHAAELAFTDVDGSAVVVETPLPEDLAIVLQKIERFDERRR